MADIKNYVYERISILKRDKKKIIHDSLLLKEDLGLDSIKVVSLLTTLCEKYDVNLMELSDYDLINLKKVEDVIYLIQKKSTN